MCRKEDFGSFFINSRTISILLGVITKRNSEGKIHNIDKVIICGRVPGVMRVKAALLKSFTLWKLPKTQY